MNDVKDSDNIPPNSRLFIVCGKSVTEDDFREKFEAFGQVDGVQIHKDRKGESKGIAYIKFSKTSEAALAVEEMNGRCLGRHPRPLKVMIAQSKDQGTSRASNDDERLLRLFVVISRETNDEDLKNYFNTFGNVQYVNIVRDKDTKESKGFAYIKFYRLVHAAKAFESCDKSYKAVFAEPRPPRHHDDNHNRNYPQHITNGYHMANAFSSSSFSYPNHNPHIASLSPYSANEPCRLTVQCSLTVNEDQLWRLFDLVPGLDYCEVREVDQPNHRVLGLAVYTNPTAASYARNKLHGFEYPPGHRLIVRYDEASANGHLTVSSTSSSPPPPHPIPGDLQSLADSIAQATSLIQAANFQDRDHSPANTSYDRSYCSASLPSPQDRKSVV